MINILENQCYLFIYKENLTESEQKPIKIINEFSWAAEHKINTKIHCISIL